MTAGDRLSCRSGAVSPTAGPPADPTMLAELRGRIGRIAAGGARAHPAGAPLPLGVAEIDAVLPGQGLPRGSLHEILAADGSVAASAFAAVLLARLGGEDRPVLWCRRGQRVYGPGLAAFGLDLARLLLVRARRETEVLWAMEEGLRSAAVAAVLGEVAGVPPVARRRLQLAAEAGGSTALLLRPFGTAAGTGSATTRWRVGSAPSPPPRALGSGPPGVTKEGRRAGPPGVRWRLQLLRCRTAAPADWLVDWCDATRRFAVAAPLPDRPAAPAAADRRAAAG